MKAQQITRLAALSKNPEPLTPAELPIPEPGAGEALLKVRACGVCHTELDEIEGRAAPPRLPVTPGHQVVGEVVGLGRDCRLLRIGDRVGVGWIFSACGRCAWCRSGQENLCPEFAAAGRDAHGGYAEYMLVREDFAIPIPEALSDLHAAPLLCAGAVGYRSLRLANLPADGRLGLTGFGASGHLVLKAYLGMNPRARVYVFSRSPGERRFALELGAAWAGEIGERSPEKLHAIIDTTPVWKPVVEALNDLLPGGRLVINAIRKESIDQDDLLKLDYARQLWMEREIKSVANVTRQDIGEFLALAAKLGLTPEVQEYTLEQANLALREVRQGLIRGAKVLRVG
jgi:propanol-preferring alcohol dehydrogenase